MNLSPFEENANDCRKCGRPLKVIEGDKPNHVESWCDYCERPVLKNRKLVQKVGEIHGIPIFDPGEEGEEF